ncbi:MAG TPA: hypothetical protein VM779_00245 [Thermoanaerobaculia bacterium]|nr:hypothetical protein [Thermoanaerobaculia bacterium]
MTGAIITAIAFPLIGAAVARLAGGGPRFLLGVGTTGFVLYATMLLRLPMLPVMIVLLLAAIAVLASFPRRAPRESVQTSAAATVVTIAPVVFLLFASAIIPLRDYDGRAFWVLKAKAIANERMVDGPFFRGEHGPNPKNEYPLLVPIANAAVMVAGGSSDDLAIRWMYVLALGSFALHARRYVGAWPAALIPWLPQFAISPEGGALSAYNDIFLAAFAGCAFFELVERASPFRFGVWLSFLVLTKNEGLPFAVLLLAAAVVIWRRRLPAALPAFGAALCTLLAWRSRVEPTDDDPLILLLSTLPERTERLLPAINGYLAYAGDLEQWGLFWIAVALAVILLAMRRDWRTLAVPLILMIGMSAVYIAAYMVTTWQLQDHLAASADRLLMHLVAPALYLIGSAARPRAG